MAHDVEAFLAGSFVKGVGKVFAHRIVEKFGSDILEPNFDFARLKDIKGLRDSTVQEISESISALKVTPKVMVKLYGAGLNDTDIEKIISHYGSRTEKILEWDPYDMVENVWKFSFFSADKIGKHMGISPEDPRRLRGALLTAVKIYAENGSMFATEEEALATASKISGVAKETFMPLIDNLVEDGRMVKSMGGLYLPPYFKAEKEAAEKILKLNGKEAEYEDHFDVPQKDLAGHTLSEGQKEAIRSALKNRVTVITGGPGTGKTTTVNGIINIMLGMGKKVVLTAPTGRAAKRMSELTGEEARTIHRLLGYSMGRGYKNKKIKTDILIIDEASMLEQVIFNHLLQALDDDTRVVLVGDTDQLPSIGAGTVLADMIESGNVPVVNLTENFRQQDGSMIAVNAANIKEGSHPEKTPASDFIFIEEDGSRRIKERLMSLVAKEIPAYTGIEPKDIQVVTPQQEGPLGAKVLNLELQERINPDAPEIKRGMKRFRLGDRVMQTTNSSIRGIYNGETGWISAMDTQAGHLEVTFFDGKKSLYGLKELKELSLAYATTVHKLQGSETDYMVLVLTTGHRQLLYRNLLYTGVSRAKKLCVIIGEEKAMAMALNTTDKLHRNSNFKHRLSTAPSE